ncbi:hypothetical protein PNP85_02795 [Halobacterium salinarum]|uniref:hypothetical protein n=1 Tax=Halobacterium salinarum TaxID=2242 RepID=UPI002553A366|nr:hypothetical protein [Halobacterium salinarum]MDL0136206.1 hypothetical protein [Halobacterium salinarum]MDL0138439.1 hypothetical protein [Halobacterium salinarum]
MSETYTITLEVDVDVEKLEEQIQTDLTHVTGKEITGTAEADLDEILTEAVTGATLTDSNAPEPIGFAIEHAVMKRK